MLLPALAPRFKISKGISWGLSSVKELESLSLLEMARFVPIARMNIKMNVMIMRGSGLKFKSLLSEISTE